MSIYEAIRDDDHLLLQSHLKGMGNLSEYRDKDGSNLLHLALENRNACMLKYFIEMGCNVNCKNNSDETPLMLTMNINYMDTINPSIVKFLVEAGADIHERDEFENDPFNLCFVEENHVYDRLDEAKILLAAGADVNTQDLMELEIAISNDDYSTLQSILQHSDISTYRDNCSNNLLHLSSKYCNVNMVKYFIDAGCDVDEQNRAGEVPLLSAIKSTHIQSCLPVIKLLLKAGANINVKDSKGRDAFQSCFSNDELNDRLDAATLIYNAGANINTRDFSKLSPLHTASNYLKLESVKFLLNLGADANLKDKTSQISLHLASKAFIDPNDEKFNRVTHYHVLKCLVEQGAYVNAPDIDDVTPFHLLLETGYQESIELFLRNGAHLNTRDTHDHGPIAYAVKNSHENVFNLIVDKCIRNDKSFSQMDYSTALRTAVADGYTENVKVLCKKGADLNAFDAVGDRPLFRVPIFYVHKICGQNQDDLFELEKLLELLFDKGADPNVQNHFGIKALNVFSGMEKLLHAFLRMLVKVKFLNQGIQDNFLNYTPAYTLELRRHEEEIRIYLKNCLNELLILKDILILDNTPLLPLLKSDCATIAQYAKNERLIEVFDNMSLPDNFPIYGTFVHNQLASAKLKYELEIDVIEELSFILPEQIRIDSIIRKIASYLYIDDLVKIAEPLQKYLLNPKTKRIKICDNNLIII